MRTSHGKFLNDCELDIELRRAMSLMRAAIAGYGSADAASVLR